MTTADLGSWLILGSLVVGLAVVGSAYRREWRRG